MGNLLGELFPLSLHVFPARFQERFDLGEILLGDGFNAYRAEDALPLEDEEQQEREVTGRVFIFENVKTEKMII